MFGRKKSEASKIKADAKVKKDKKTAKKPDSERAKRLKQQRLAELEAEEAKLRETDDAQEIEDITTQKKKKVVIQSTQMNLPIKSFVNGIVLTSDNRFVKIIEVLPGPFFLQPVKEQNTVFSEFASLLKSCPVNIQIKTVSLPADLSDQIAEVDEMEHRPHASAPAAFYEDYKNRLYQSQRMGTKFRYFIVLERRRDRGKTGEVKTAELRKATKDLLTSAYRIDALLGNMGNETTMSGNAADEERMTAEIFYSILNRGILHDQPFATRMETLEKRYEEYYKGAGDNHRFYIPATDIIAPERIDYTNMNYLIVNDTYYKFMFIPSDGYPDSTYTGWLYPFIASSKGIDIDIFAEKVDPSTITSSLRRKIGHSEADISSSNDNSDAFDSASSTLASARYLLAGITGSQDFFYVSTLITVSGNSPEEVDDKIDALMKSAAENDTKLLVLKNQNEAAFLSTLPLCKLDPLIKMKAKQNMLTDGLATFYPFLTHEMNHKHGIYIGDDYSTGSLVTVNFFNRKVFTSPNIFVSGTTGAGKTFSLLLMAIRIRLSQIPVYIIAPEKENEFGRLTEEMGGQFVQIYNGSPSRINILDLFLPSAEAEKELAAINGSVGSSSLVAQKCQTVERLFGMLLGDGTKLEFEEKQALSMAVKNTYAKFGITENNDTIWADSARNIKKTMPILSDLGQTLREEKAPTRVIMLLDYMTKGAGASFDGQTNVNTDSDFMVFGLERNSKEMLPVAVFIAMDFIWSKFKMDRTKRKFLMIDEWWRMAFNDVAAEYSMEIAKTIRAYNGGVLFATQQMSDVIQSGPTGAGVIGNCATKIIMRSTESDLDAISTLATLTKNERKTILKFKQGDALMIAGNSRMLIHFVASENETLLCGTDDETLKKYKEKRKEMEAEEAEMQRVKRMTDALNNAMDISSWQNESVDDVAKLLHKSKEIKGEE